MATTGAAAVAKAEPPTTPTIPLTTVVAALVPIAAAVVNPVAAPSKFPLLIMVGELDISPRVLTDVEIEFDFCGLFIKIFGKS